MWYVDLRYTFADEYQKTDLQFLKYVQKVLDPYILDKTYIGSIEHKNKLGEDTKYHIHFRFKSVTPIPTIRRQFVRKIFQECNDNRKLGKNIYYMKAIVEIDDEKFWRYPLKQIKSENDLKTYSISNNLDAEKLRSIAYASWLTAQQVQHSKVANKEPTTFIERAYHYVDQSGESEYEEVFCKLVEFYVLQDKPLESNRVKGYTYNYMIKKNYISVKEYYNLMH